MIREAHGNLLEADVEALVNTVNTHGVMGKGIALQFKRAFPEMFKDYARAAKIGRIQIGRMHVWHTEVLEGPRIVISFPTKRHWRSPSRLEDIDAGLKDLVRVIKELEIRSIAVPPLGCGNGGLDWADVEPMIRSAFESVHEVEVLLYPPGKTPAASSMLSSPEAPTMTPGRAALVSMLSRYSHVALQASLIETQKLLYFLQTAGEPLHLEYTKGHYGPYADNLRHVLNVVEGHYLRGFGDGSSAVLEAEPLVVMPGADERAGHVLREHPETEERIERVLGLVDGFESAYGLELLASVHWAATDGRQQPARGVDESVELVRTWTQRKARMFTRHHIVTAYSALLERGWLARAAS